MNLTMASGSHSRITYKPARPNPLFLQWILELHAEAVAKDFKNQHTMKEAINSLKRYPVPLQSGSECAILKGFGKKLCAYLDNRLKAHQRQIANGEIANPSSFYDENMAPSSNDVQHLATAAETSSLSCNIISYPLRQIEVRKSQKKSGNYNKCYKPRYRTGAYAVLIALMEHVDSCPANLSLTKEELIEKAQPFCEESFTRPKPDSHYAAWSSVTQLVNKQLVTRMRKKKAQFSLTDAGYALAIELYDKYKDKPISTIDANSFDSASILMKSSSSHSSQRSGSQQIRCLFNDQPSVHDLKVSDCMESIDATPRNLTECEPLPRMRVITNGITDQTLQVGKINRYYDKNESAKYDESYTPRYGTDPYAILLALMEHVNSCPDKLSLTIEELIEKVQPYCEESFEWSSDTHFTASVVKLVNEQLITKVKNEKEGFSLTDTGYLLAMELSGVYKDIPNTADTGNSGIPLLLASSSSQQYSSQKMSSQSTESTEVEELDDFIDCQDVVILPPGSFDVILLIDKQEVNAAKRKDEYATVTQFDKYTNLNREDRHLKVGDFTWVARHRTTGQELVLPYIVERKRMDDLSMSIKDGRFHEQKFRLNKCGIPNVIYLVENFGKNMNVGLPLMSLMQSISNTRVQNGFKIHTTDSLAGTVRFLAIVTKRLTLEYKNKELKGHSNTPTGDFLMTFKHFSIASAKNKTPTVQEAFIKMLLQLKGMSVEKALAITDTYKTPRVLMEKYKSCSQREGETLLAKLKYDDLSRNIGPVTSKALYKLFTLDAFQ